MGLLARVTLPRVLVSIATIAIVNMSGLRSFVLPRG